MEDYFNKPIQTQLTQNELDYHGWQSYNERREELTINEQVKADFLANTRSIKDILNLPPEERPEVEITCIDERAVISVADRDGNINIIHINTPGGGTEFLEDEDIEQIILKSNGTIRINSHKLCGWGEYVFNEILNGTAQQLTERGESEGHNKLNGVLRIMASIKLAIDDGKDVFWKMYEQEIGELGIDKEDFINKAREYVLRKARNEESNHDEHKFEVLVQQAFVHGKTIKLATRFDKIHEKMVIRYKNFPEEGKGDVTIPPKLEGRLQISTGIDTLENAPHSHVANDAIVNMTKGFVLTSRFQIKGKDAFFARVGTNKAYSLVDLILRIMEGDHSDTKDDLHTIHIFFDDETVAAQMEEELSKLLDGPYKDRRKIVIHLVGPEDIKDASPLPKAT